MGIYTLWVGGLAILTALIAGGTAFQGWPQITTICAALSAALSVVSTFLNPQDKAVIHKRAGDQFLSLKNQTRFFRTIELSDLSNIEASDKLKRLADKRDELNSLSPTIPKYAYKDAIKGISLGESAHQVDL
jgi:hypothetical protein